MEISGPEQGCYVYGITRADGDCPLDDTRGMGVEGSGPVYAVACRDISAIASNVSLDEFGEEALKSNLSDPEWLAEKAQAHHRVLVALGACRSVAPMRLFTICLSEQRIRAMLIENHDRFLDVLARLDGTQEWGIKLYSRGDELRESLPELSDAVRSLQADLDGRTGGAAYFRGKKLEETAASEMERIRDEVVDESYARLARHAAGSAVCSSTSREATGRPDDMILNAAYLVSRDRLEGFRAELDALCARNVPLGFAYELSGPWPPYNFAQVDACDDKSAEPQCCREERHDP